LRSKDTLVAMETMVSPPTAGGKTAVIWLLDNREVFGLAEGESIVFVFPNKLEEKTGSQTLKERFWSF